MYQPTMQVYQICITFYVLPIGTCPPDRVRPIARVERVGCVGFEHKHCAFLCYFAPDSGPFTAFSALYWYGSGAIWVRAKNASAPASECQPGCQGHHSSYFTGLFSHAYLKAVAELSLGMMWTYCMVVSMFSCPRVPWMTPAGTPRRCAWVAWECLNQWGENLLSFFPSSSV